MSGIFYIFSFLLIYLASNSSKSQISGNKILISKLVGLFLFGFRSFLLTPILFSSLKIWNLEYITTEAYSDIHITSLIASAINLIIILFLIYAIVVLLKDNAPFALIPTANEPIFVTIGMFGLMLVQGVAVINVRNMDFVRLLMLFLLVILLLLIRHLIIRAVYLYQKVYYSQLASFLASLGILFPAYINLVNGNFVFFNLILAT